MKILLPAKRKGPVPETRGYLMKYEMLDKLLEEKRAVFENISDRIWEFAETRFQEKQSTGLQMETLRTEGFDIEEGIGGIETAFCAKFGSGHPVIGILGEYDALPGMSQKADVTEKMPEKEGAPGHGCGHHLLGTGGMEAAVAVKDYLMKNPMDGTVIYYGCPGEEGGAGKAFMVSAYSDVLQNKTLDQLVFSHIREIYPLKYTEEEMACAEKFHKVGDPGDWKTYQGLAKQFYGEKGNAFFRGAMADTIFPPVPVKMGSTDVGDVSWTVPTAWFGSACYALGTPAHSWLAVAQGKSGIAKRGMEAAASVIARTTLDIMENPQIAKKPGKIWKRLRTDLSITA